VVLYLGIIRRTSLKHQLLISSLLKILRAACFLGVTFSAQNAMIVMAKC
jgi:hypothetical protein